jgi:hypothetical protein
MGTYPCLCTGSPFQYVVIHKNGIRTRTRRKAVLGREVPSCVVCHTPVQYEILEARKTRAGQKHLFPEQEITFHCLLVTPSCSTCCPAVYVLRLLCDLNQLWKYSWGGAGKTLAQPTSRCCRTDSIVSLERRVCSCAELRVFSCYRGWNEACQVTCVISTTSRREVSPIFFLQGKALKEIHAILMTKT